MDITNPRIAYIGPEAAYKVINDQARKVFGLEKIQRYTSIKEFFFYETRGNQLIILDPKTLSRPKEEIEKLNRYGTERKPHIILQDLNFDIENIKDLVDKPNISYLFKERKAEEDLSERTQRVLTDLRNKGRLRRDFHVGVIGSGPAARQIVKELALERIQRNQLGEQVAKVLWYAPSIANGQMIYEGKPITYEEALISYGIPNPRLVAQDNTDIIDPYKSSLNPTSATIEYKEPTSIHPILFFSNAEELLEKEPAVIIFASSKRREDTTLYKKERDDSRVLIDLMNDSMENAIRFAQEYESTGSNASILTVSNPASYIANAFNRLLPELDPRKIDRKSTRLNSSHYS